MLYVFFVVHHARRELMHFRVTGHPTAAWITQQLREALPYDQAPRYLILDRDAKYGNEVLTAIRHMSIEPKQITARSPWQNGVAERFVSAARRDFLDHVIVLNEKHLQRLLAGFASYYLNDRTHLSLKKETPAVRLVEPKPHPAAEVIAYLALAGFIIATLGAARPDDSARQVHRRGLVVEGVCPRRKAHRGPQSATGHDRGRHTEGRVRSASLPAIPLRASYQQCADSIVAKHRGSIIPSGLSPGRMDGHPAWDGPFLSALGAVSSRFRWNGAAVREDRRLAPPANSGGGSAA